MRLCPIEKRPQDDVQLRWIARPAELAPLNAKHEPVVSLLGIAPLHGFERDAVKLRLVEVNRDRPTGVVNGPDVHAVHVLPVPIALRGVPAFDRLERSHHLGLEQRAGRRQNEWPLSRDGQRQRLERAEGCAEARTRRERSRPASAYSGWLHRNAGTDDRQARLDFDLQDHLAVTTDLYGLRPPDAALAAEFVAPDEPGRVDRMLGFANPDRQSDFTVGRPDRQFQPRTVSGSSERVQRLVLLDDGHGFERGDQLAFRPIEHGGEVAV